MADTEYCDSLESYVSGFSAWVSVVKPSAADKEVFDSFPLRIYHISCDKSDFNVYGYIASQLNKNFAVQWQDNKRVKNTLGKVYLDGFYVGESLIRKKKKGTPDSEDDAHVSSIRTSANTKRSFMFSGLDLTANEDGGNINTNLGTIKLEIWAIKINGKKKPSQYLEDTTLPTGSVHESAKPPGSHRIQLGPPVPADESEDEPTPASDMISDVPLAIFQFTYRPLDILQAEGILPSSSKRKRRGRTTSRRSPPSSRNPSEPTENNRVNNRIVVTNEEARDNLDVKLEEDVQEFRPTSNRAGPSQGESIRSREYIAADKRARAKELQAEVRLLKARAEVLEAEAEIEEAKTLVESVERTSKRIKLEQQTFIDLT